MSRNNDIYLRVQKALNERFGFGQGEYVDLGLPSGTLWATCNLGANEPHESGLYFAWGETTGYTAEQIGKDKQFEEGDYDYFKNNSICDSYGILKPEFDAATMDLGNEWRMPTWDEIKELLALKNKWVENYNETGVNGRLFVSRNGKTLFLPAAGDIGHSLLDGVGGHGDYWSSSLYMNSVWGACHLYFDKRESDWGSNYRFFGFSIRPVR